MIQLLAEEITVRISKFFLKQISIPPLALPFCFFLVAVLEMHLYSFIYFGRVTCGFSCHVSTMPIIGALSIICCSSWSRLYKLFKPWIFQKVIFVILDWY